jgi:hypothetical protein
MALRYKIYYLFIHEKIGSSYIKWRCCKLFYTNRTGEFLGRLIFISKNKLPDALSATWVTNMAQLTITLLAGLTSVCFCIDYFFESKQIQGYIILIAFISFLIIAWAYFQLNVV